MSLIKDKLSAMKPGSRVRITNVSGQVIDGIVTENDGSESLSVEVKITSTIRYNQVGMIELCDNSSQIVKVTQEVTQTEKGIEIVKVACDIDAISSAFRAMESDERKILTSALNKFQSGLKDHEEKKCKESLDLAVKKAGENKWEQNINVNRFLALLYLANDDNGRSAEAFFYGDDPRSAYRAAYHGADKTNDRSLYRLAASFAVVYLSKDVADTSEALDVLKEASIKSEDVSGIGYILTASCFKNKRNIVSDIVRDIGRNFSVSNADTLNIDRLYNALGLRLSGKEIGKSAEKYIALIPKPQKPAEAVLPKPEDKPKPGPDTVKEYQGNIVKYKFSEQSGSIEAESGDTYTFELNDITDPSLKTQVGNITSRTTAPIPVKFKLTKRYGKYVAESISRGVDTTRVVSPKPVKPVKSGNNTMSAANMLYSQGDFNGALNIYKTRMDTPEWEDAFSQIIMCYIALNKENENLGYMEELKAFVDKYVEKTSKNPKTLEVLRVYYMKSHDYDNAVIVLNNLIEQCDSSDYLKILDYLTAKARCYRFLKNYPSAISDLLAWIDIVKQFKIKERQHQCYTYVYIELADLYYEIGDYENSEKYAKLAQATERKTALVNKLSAKKAEMMSETDQEEETYKDETLEEIDTSISEPEETLQNAYEAYSDDVDFEMLGLDDTDIINKALSFKSDQLYCLLTYLNTSAELSAESPLARITENGEKVYVAQALKDVNDAFSYAFNSPFIRYEYLSTEILTVFESAKKYIPDQIPSMLASASLYALFETQSTQDYTFSDLDDVVSEYCSEQYPALIPVIKRLCSFKEKTGCGIDTFSEYKTSSGIIDKVISEAIDCCKAVDMRNEAYESQGQVRRTRELIFSKRESELRSCLDIVAANDTKKYHYVKDIMSEHFCRTGKVVSVNSLDSKKIDKYIDRYWDVAKEAMLSEGKIVSHPFDKMKGSRRNNVVVTMRRILSCICDWLSVSEYDDGKVNAYAIKLYQENAPLLEAELSDLIKACEDSLAENGFNWGTESLRRASCELRDKINGSYNTKLKKYFFMDFLTGEDILLNDSFMPETQSTFCGMHDFCILNRIEHHANSEHPSLYERLSQILSNEESKHNFRSAQLIREYGEDLEITAITGHKDLPQLAECLKQAKRRFERKYQDFAEELDYCVSKGTLLNINGEKDKLSDIAFVWYRITRITNDYGFYVKLLENIRHTISVNALKKGEALFRQLEEIANNPNYKDKFGVFTKELISDQINDQNYTSAEYMMSCILRGDVSAISDYSAEPFGYFDEFISEHSTNYRAVQGAGRNITDAILDYSGKRDMEIALLHLTNNARKETKGGANLIKSWMPKGGPASEELIESLVSRLGFKPASVKRDISIDTEAYRVVCRKRIGKVNYVHSIPAFGTMSETDGFRVLCLYGKYDCGSLMDKFREVNTTSQNTIALLDYALNMEERRRLARKIKEEKTFANTFILIDRVILFYLAKHYAENTILKRMLAVTLPFAYYQPFVEQSKIDMPPELFTGRELALTSIESPNGASLVYGGRQLGKSVLLKMARHNINNNGNGDRAVLIDIKDLTSAEAAPVVCDKLIIEGILDESCRCDSWLAIAGHLQRRLNDENPDTRIRYLLLMLDEADEFISTSGDSADQPITALKSLPSNRFKLVMAGLHNVSRYHRELTHMNSALIHLAPIVIKQFSREEATKLLTSTLAYLGFRLNQGIIDNILASTYNYPGLIQLYCQKLIEAMKNGDYAGYSQMNTPNYVVTELHYKRVLSDPSFTHTVNEKFEVSLFTEEEKHSNYHIIALIIAYLYYDAPNDKGYTQDDILKVAEEYKITRVLSWRPEQFSEILNEMYDLNVITVMDNYYRFATEGFRKFLGSRQKVENSISEYFEEE